MMKDRYIVIEFSDSGNRFTRVGGCDVYKTNDISKHFEIIDGTYKICTYEHSVIIIDLENNLEYNTDNREWHSI